MYQFDLHDLFEGTLKIKFLNSKNLTKFGYQKKFCTLQNALLPFLTEASVAPMTSLVSQTSSEKWELSSKKLKSQYFRCERH